MDSDEFILLQQQHRTRDLELLVIILILLKNRSSPIYRSRWNASYIRSLAIEEDAFRSEYGMDVFSFDLLLEMLKPRLSVNQAQSQRANPSSSFITEESRLGS